MADLGTTLTAALDEVAHIARRQRRELPSQLTDAYVRFELAYGYARIGNKVAASKLIDAAHAELGGFRDDPVHRYLAAAFEALLEQVLAGARAPVELKTGLDELDRVNRYRVDRF